MRAGPVVPLTSFVGRRSELRTIRRLLASARFLTLVGPGGCGKTRLAVELARHVTTTDVVWLDLTPLRTADEVHALLAYSLEIAAPPERIADALADRLRDTPTLLVLDNCEHLLDPVAELAVRVLTAADCVRVLATSREPVDVAGELVWRVPSLSVPDAAYANDPVRCSRSDAVRLFVERARLAQPRFALDAMTCQHVVAICRAVDGIPLAIELAAARLRHLSVADLAGRLDDLLSLLVGGRRAADPRHRALRVALDWSHDLLAPIEQRAFRRLAIFAGGFRIAAAEAVCVDDQIARSEILSLVTSLADKSLIVPPADGERYRLLWPIREYALDRLRGNGEEDLVTQRCARHFVDLVLRALPDSMGMSTGSSVMRVAEEFANITAILPWLTREEPAKCLELLGRLAQNAWMLVPMHLGVVGAWLDRALEVHTARDASRVHGLLGQISVLLQLERDPARARRMADEAVAISCEIDDATLQALALRASAHVAVSEDASRAMREYDAAIPLLRTCHLGGLALALSARAILRQRHGDRAGAQEDLAEALRAWDRQFGPSSSFRVLTLLPAADVAFQAGDIDAAEAHLRQAIDLARRATDLPPSAARSMLVAPVEFLAHLAAVRGENERAAILSGSADRWRDDTGIWPRPWFSLTDRSWLADLDRRLGPRARSLRSEGRRLSVSEVLDLALRDGRGGALSPRELSVAELVAEGLTDKEIAARLAISERTAESHVHRIREKLGLRSRAQIGRWTADHLTGVR